MEKVGVLSPVSVRDIWKDEAKHFTPPVWERPTRCSRWQSSRRRHFQRRDQSITRRQNDFRTISSESLFSEFGENEHFIDKFRTRSARQRHVLVVPSRLI